MEEPDLRIMEHGSLQAAAMILGDKAEVTAWGRMARASGGDEIDELSVFESFLTRLGNEASQALSIDLKDVRDMEPAVFERLARFTSDIRTARYAKPESEWDHWGM